MGHFFVDTFYWIALLHRRDQWYARVTAFSQTLTDADSLVTTDAVLLEFLAAMSAAGTSLRHEAATRVDDMFEDPSVRVIEMTRTLFVEGMALYKARPDKEYSLLTASRWRSCAASA
jgi:hypothetical protein